MFHFSWIQGLFLLAGNRPAAKIPVPMPPCHSTKSDEVCHQITHQLLMDFIMKTTLFYEKLFTCFEFKIMRAFGL